MKIKNLQSVTITIASSSASNTGTLSGFTSIGQMVVLDCTWTTPDLTGSVTADRIFVEAEIDSTTSVRVERWGSPSHTLDATVVVAELDSATDVYKGNWTMGDTDSTTGNISIGATVTTDESYCWGFAEREGSGSESFDFDPQYQCCYFELVDSAGSASNLKFTRDTGDGQISGRWYVVSSSALTVQHLSSSPTLTTTTSTMTVSPSVTTTDTFLKGSFANDAYYTDELPTLDLQSGSSARWERIGTTSYNYEFRCQVITDSNIVVDRERFSDLSYQSPYSTNRTVTGITDTDLSTAGFPGGNPSHSNEYSGQGYAETAFYEAELISTSQVQLRCGRAVDEGYVSWEVVQFPEDLGGSARRIMVIS